MVSKTKKPTLIEEVRRKQIVETAIETIAQRGFSGTTLSDIAQQAGVSTGVITYHFRNKDDLMEQSIKKLFEEPNSFVLARVDRATTHRARLRAYIQANVDFMRDHRSHSVALIYFFGSISSDQERHRIMMRQHAAIRKYLCKILKAGQASGEFGPFHAETVAQLIFAAIEGIMIQLTLDEGAADLARCAEELIAMAEGRILARSPG